MNYLLSTLDSLITGFGLNPLKQYLFICFLQSDHINVTVYVSISVINHVLNACELNSFAACIAINLYAAMTYNMWQ